MARVTQSAKVLAARLDGASSHLEEARQRIHLRLLARWPAAFDRNVAACTDDSFTRPEESTAKPAYLEEARQRLRARYAARWPAPPALSPPSESVAAAAGAHATGAEDFNAATSPYLETARLRLRARFAARWPLSAGGPLLVGAEEDRIASTLAVPGPSGNLCHLFPGNSTATFANMTTR
jgi:hypothetical protein